MLALGLAVVVPPKQASAAPVYVQSTGTFNHNSTTNTATFVTPATAGNLIVVICGAETGTITTPTGFTTAIYQTGSQAQGIYYKVSTGGEATLSCTTSSSFSGIHIYEYSGMDTVSPLMTTGSATGTSNSPSSGLLTTTAPNALLITGITIQGTTAFSAWSNSFTERYDGAISSGSPNSRHTFGGATRIVGATGTYSTTATAGASGNWRGQIVAFREQTTIPVLSVDIVDATGNSVASPSASLAAVNADFTCQLTTGTLGVSAQRIRITNTTVTPTWTVAVAATDGATAQWTSGTNTYDFNDPSGTPAGCNDGADTDNRPGQLSLDPSVGTITPQSGCATTGVTRGSNAGFNEGVVNSITLISASSSAQTNCYWDFTDTALSQRIPADQPVGSYSINLTLTVTAS